jgi:hypothetical protein
MDYIYANHEATICRHSYSTHSDNDHQSHFDLSSIPSPMAKYMKHTMIQGLCLLSMFLLTSSTLVHARIIGNQYIKFIFVILMYTCR